MDTIWLISYIVLWLIVLFLGFLLLGTLRTLGLLNWRLEQLTATTPRRLGRDGLMPGKKAPDFTLPSAAGKEVSLRDFAGRTVLLVFTQPGCGPCQPIIPALKSWHAKGRFQVVMVTNGDEDKNPGLADKVAGAYPILFQEDFRVSRRYQTFATPFAFLIDESGIIRAKGIINNEQHIQFLVSSAKTEDSAGGVTATVGMDEQDDG